MNIYTYEQLPELAKKALDEYPYLDSEFHNEYKYKLYEVSMEQAIKNIMSYDELGSSYSTFEEYHKDYSCVGLPNHKKQYPVFHEPENDYEWLSDGWHRLHSYYRNGFKSVPAMEIIFE